MLVAREFLEKMVLALCASAIGAFDFCFAAGIPKAAVLSLA
jgi:hypothetical protein